MWNNGDRVESMDKATYISVPIDDITKAKLESWCERNDFRGNVVLSSQGKCWNAYRHPMDTSNVATIDISD
jgi:hypothetical protein